MCRQEDVLVLNDLIGYIFDFTPTFSSDTVDQHAVVTSLGLLDIVVVYTGKIPNFPGV